MFAGRVFGRDGTVEGTTVRVLLVQFCEAGGTLVLREKAHTKWQGLRFRNWTTFCARMRGRASCL